MILLVGARPFGWSAYGLDLKEPTKQQFQEHHDVALALPLTEKSKGYCPICGYWSIITNIIVDDKTNTKGDKCLNCDAVFDLSGLEFLDSKTCQCGHPKDYHEKNILSCVKGKQTNNCQCQKYRPTKVTVESKKSL